MKNRRKQGKIFRSLLTVLMLTAMLVTSVLQPVFAGDYEAGKTGNLTLTVQQADEEGNQTPLPDVGLTIYKVGSVNFDGNVHFVLDEALALALPYNAKVIASKIVVFPAPVSPVIR